MTDRPLVGCGPLSPRFDEAVGLAADLHRAQVRKGTNVPYLAHLLAVAALVLEQGGDEDEAIASLLHDAVEDQGGQPTLIRIRERFGERVAAIVAACSDTDQQPKPPWRERKEAYIAHLGQPGLDPGVLRVSLANKLHNLRASSSTCARRGPPSGGASAHLPQTSSGTTAHWRTSSPSAPVAPGPRSSWAWSRTWSASPAEPRPALPATIPSRSSRRRGRDQRAGPGQAPPPPKWGDPALPSG